MLDRIGELRSEAEAAIAAASATAELEELRVRYLGRKAELTTILRGIAALPPEERGAVGKAGNEARTALEALLERRGAELAERVAQVHAALAVRNDDGPVGATEQLSAGSRQVSETSGARRFTGIGLEHHVAELANSFP